MSRRAAMTRPPGQRQILAAWVIQAFLAVIFLGAASAKLAGAPTLVAVFDQIGAGQWFRYVTALVEFAGAIALVVPGYALYGAAVLAITMIAAAAIHLFVLHTSPAGAVLLLAASLAVLWLRWRKPSGG